MNAETPHVEDHHGLVVGVLDETTEREHRIALDPGAVRALVTDGHTVLMETGAGNQAAAPDTELERAGAEIHAGAVIVERANILALLHAPTGSVIQHLHAGQVIIGLLNPFARPEVVGDLAVRGISVIALDALPRTLSRAQTLDALSSQSSAAGYRAALIAAQALGRYLPMMTTAAGTARPAQALVLGAGVAGLQAIATLKRLGAVVTGYDVRPTSRGEVEALGAKFLASTINAAGAGGYARSMAATETDRQQRELADACAEADVVVATARVPGGPPPVLVTHETLARMAPASVCVDLAAGALGGNVEGSSDGEQRTTSNGVVIIGDGDAAAGLPVSASQMYGRNIVATIRTIAPDAVLRLDAPDELLHAIVIAHDGRITDPRLAELVSTQEGRSS
ncbi:NAD(P) transhydrogenase subunit alpha [Curtobacterium sp. PhB115]|uniref:NAD(P) transhydrogenase subunit alpha n=1 Tax=Curtobacterium sp. PhB115 TaxID=2485173 RepID=UPI000F4BD2B9|nr:NAD(P) transhydrogenase subunit alpha [Curtobacterium sp. PhB115]ROP58660.1 NAD(P) transhydrogenase subunit alpha [Curtobacterium sp. PhB115]